MQQNKEDIKRLCEIWLVVHGTKQIIRKVTPPPGAAPVSKTGGIAKRSGVRPLRLPLEEAVSHQPSAISQNTDG